MLLLPCSYTQAPNRVLKASYRPCLHYFLRYCLIFPSPLFPHCPTLLNPAIPQRPSLCSPLPGIASTFFTPLTARARRPPPCSSSLRPSSSRFGQHTLSFLHQDMRRLNFRSRFLKSLVSRRSFLILVLNLHHRPSFLPFVALFRRPSRAFGAMANRGAVEGGGGCMCRLGLL